jgi:hypothetical protein
VIHGRAPRRAGAGGTGRPDRKARVLVWIFVWLVTICQWLIALFSNIFPALRLGGPVCPSFRFGQLLIANCHLLLLHPLGNTPHNSKSTDKICHFFERE